MKLSKKDRNDLIRAAKKLTLGRRKNRPNSIYSCYAVKTETDFDTYSAYISVTGSICVGFSFENDETYPRFEKQLARSLCVLMFSEAYK